MNRVELTVDLMDIGPLRHTPAGIPILQLTLAHRSQVQEAGSLRTVALELQAVALGDLAQSLAGAQVHSQFQVSGFLAPQRQGSDRLVLHLQQITQTH